MRWCCECQRPGPHLPMQPRPNLVGSSEVNMRTSMGLAGLNPADCSPLTAAMAPMTPSVPSYAPAKGMASQWEPVTTAPAATTGPKSVYNRFESGSTSLYGCVERLSSAPHSPRWATAASPAWPMLSSQPQPGRAELKTTCRMKWNKGCVRTADIAAVLHTVTPEQPVTMAARGANCNCV